MRLFQQQLQTQNIKSRHQLLDSITNLILAACQKIHLSLQISHLALWVFHCQVKICGFKNFDRYIFSIAAILIASKLGESLRKPIDIIKIFRTQIRFVKSLTSVDSQQKLTKMVKKVLQAEIHLMINIGFDFDIETALTYLNLMKKFILDSFIYQSTKKTLTSLYKTDVVLYFDPKDIAICALQLVIQEANLNIHSFNFDANIMQRFQSSAVKQAKYLYLNQWIEVINQSNMSQQ